FDRDDELKFIVYEKPTGPMLLQLMKGPGESLIYEYTPGQPLPSTPYSESRLRGTIRIGERRYDLIEEKNRTGSDLFAIDAVGRPAVSYYPSAQGGSEAVDLATGDVYRTDNRQPVQRLATTAFLAVTSLEGK